MFGSRRISPRCTVIRFLVYYCYQRSLKKTQINFMHNITCKLVSKGKIILHFVNVLRKQLQLIKYSFSYCVYARIVSIISSFKLLYCLLYWTCIFILIKINAGLNCKDGFDLLPSFCIYWLLLILSVASTGCQTIYTFISDLLL